MKLPQIYYYYKKDLDLIRFPYWKLSLYLVSFGFVLSFSSYLYGRIDQIRNLSDLEKEILIIDINNRNDFNQDKLVTMLKDLNVRFPHIVVAQARLETGGYKSRIFKENNNLFGMKQATVRVNTASGTQHNHAYYDTWRESVYDYAFYQTRYLSGAKTESEYLYVLGQSYAEDPNYVIKLKNEIEKNNLRSLF
jgi:Mannosyl-glycoprotein endo-beta-N-acetylglucosaminidase